MKKENILTLLILVALAMGIIVGEFVLFSPSATHESLKAAAEPWRLAGDLLFIRPLRMLIIPLVFTSVLTGVTSIGNPKRLGTLGAATFAYFIGTTLLAVALGLLLVNTIKPGAGVAVGDLAAVGESAFKAEGIEQKVTTGPTGVGGSFIALLQDLIPDNVLKAAVNGNTLGVIVFAIMLGLALVLSGDPAKPAIQFFDALSAAFLKLVMWVIWIAPLGIFFLVAARIGEVGLAAIAGPLGKYAVTVFVGLAIHLFAVLPLVLFLFGRVNPYRFLWALRKVIITAISTSSSNATLPITIEESVKSGGCSKRATSFVVPLGATVNMNGTALYEAVAVSFLFQLFARENPQFALSITEQFIILITATLAAIGAAGIPSAGLVTMAIVIGAVNSSLKATHGEGAPQLPLWTIGIIIGVDRVLDMCRTVVNVMGDAIGAKIITRLAPDER